jgi:hypothetical protein
MHFVVYLYTLRSQIGCALRLRYVDFVKRVPALSTLVDITSNTFYKCTATFQTHCIMDLMDTRKMKHIAVQLGLCTC